MNRSLKKAWNTVSSILVALVVLLAILLVGARVIGLRVYTVLSGSMEPTYHTGSLIYVKKIDPFTIEEGTAITFMMDENTVATHRVVEVVPDEDDSSVIRFRTKGDANEAEDGGLVHYKNVIGMPVFTIPKLGYFANYIQNPPGKYVAIAAGAIILLLVFIPDLFGDDKEKKKERGKEEHSKASATQTKEPFGENLSDEIRRKTHNLLTDDEVETVRKKVEAGLFDETASAELAELLNRRQADKDTHYL